MVNPCDLENRYVSFAGMVVCQTISFWVSYNFMLKHGSSLSVVQQNSSLRVIVDEEALYCEKCVLENGLVCWGLAMDG